MAGRRGWQVFVMLGGLIACYLTATVVGILID